MEGCERMLFGKKVVYFILGIALSAIIVTACGKEKIPSVTDKEKIENLTLPEEKDDFINITLYFDGCNDGKTEKIGKEERIINKEELLGELIMQELIKGPSIKSDLTRILPKETRMLSFSIKDGIAIINMSKEAKVDMTEIKEKACLSSITKSMLQLPTVDKVRILIENKNVDSLGGNYDISKPFSQSEINSLKIK